MRIVLLYGLFNKISKFITKIDPTVTKTLYQPIVRSTNTWSLSYTFNYFSFTLNYFSFTLLTILVLLYQFHFNPRGKLCLICLFVFIFVFSLLQFDVKEPGIAILRQTPKFICAGDTSGSVSCLSQLTWKSEHISILHNFPDYLNGPVAK